MNEQPRRSALSGCIAQRWLGVSHRDGYPNVLLDFARDGAIGEMRPEPDNAHDPLAVGVWAWTADGPRQIGYLPAHRDDLRRYVHEHAAADELLGDISVRVSSAHPHRPGADFVFEAPVIPDDDSSSPPAASAASAT